MYDDWEKDVGQFITNIGLVFIESAIDGTPVDTGYARNNWQMATGKRPMLEVLRSKAEQAAEMQKFRISSRRLDEAVFIVNNVPYIKRLEDGHSPQNRLFFKKAVQFIDAQKENIWKRTRERRPEKY